MTEKPNNVNGFDRFHLGCDNNAGKVGTILNNLFLVTLHEINRLAFKKYQTKKQTFVKIIQSNIRRRLFCSGDDEKESDTFVRELPSFATRKKTVSCVVMNSST